MTIFLIMNVSKNNNYYHLDSRKIFLWMTSQYNRVSWLVLFLVYLFDMSRYSCYGKKGKSVQLWYFSQPVINFITLILYMLYCRFCENLGQNKDSKQGFMAFAPLSYFSNESISFILNQKLSEFILNSLNWDNFIVQANLQANQALRICLTKVSPQNSQFFSKILPPKPCLKIAFYMCSLAKSPIANSTM